MEILFLGTSAAEGWPGLFCECEACRRARALGGKNIRTRSSVVLDEDLKVDLPPDNYFHMLRYNLNFAKVRHLFITHTHYDHFHPDDLFMRRKPFAHMKKDESLHVYGNLHVIEKIELLEKRVQGLNLIPHIVNPFETENAGDFKVTPLLADHSSDEKCLLFLFEINGKVILYGHDSGWFPRETWNALKGYTLDLAILDCTNGGIPLMRYHMGIDGVMKTREQMISEHIADKDTIFVATHFSHNGGLLHDELVSKLQPMNIQAAFDGLRIEI